MVAELYNNRPATPSETVHNHFEDELLRLIDVALAQAEHLHEASTKHRCE